MNAPTVRPIGRFSDSRGCYRTEGSGFAPVIANAFEKPLVTKAFGATMQANRSDNSCGRAADHYRNSKSGYTNGIVSVVECAPDATVEEME